MGFALEVLGMYDLGGGAGLEVLGLCWGGVGAAGGFISSGCGSEGMFDSFSVVSNLDKELSISIGVICSPLSADTCVGILEESTLFSKPKDILCEV